MMGTVLGFFAAMGVLIVVIVFIGYRVDKKHQWKREEDPTQSHDPLDPDHL